MLDLEWKDSHDKTHKRVKWPHSDEKLRKGRGERQFLYGFPFPKATTNDVCSKTLYLLKHYSY